MIDKPILYNYFRSSTSVRVRIALNLKNIDYQYEALQALFENYQDKDLSLLKELNPLKVKLYDYSEFHIIETGADYQFPIHDDTPYK